MIISVSSHSLYEKRPKEFGATEMVNDYELLKELLEKSNHYFLVVHTREQGATTKLFQKYGLFDYAVHTTDKFITNCNYPGDRRLKLWVLKGKGESSAT